MGTYAITNEDYRNSMAYRNTVVTADTMYQRAPVACWYTMGVGVVRAVDSADAWTMSVRWNPSDRDDRNA
jgi:hypothetical protein